jgi:hypothetical protein
MNKIIIAGLMLFSLFAFSNTNFKKEVICNKAVVMYSGESIDAKEIILSGFEYAYNDIQDEEQTMMIIWYQDEMKFIAETEGRSWKMYQKGMIGFNRFIQLVRIQKVVGII